MTSLNESQLVVYERVVTNRYPITFLTASPGFGKSYTTAVIAKQFRKVALTASSHKAKQVLSDMTHKPADTVHKYMGYVMVREGYKMNLIPKTNHRLVPCDLMVVDEVSMLPNRILLAILEAHKEGIFKQLLFVGDVNQLPAVSDEPAISKLLDHKVELTQQMRQDSCKLLANHFQSMKSAIEDYKVVPLLTESPLVEYISSHREFIDRYGQLLNGTKRILAYRNSVVDKYNGYLSCSEGGFSIGDRVLIDKPLLHLNNQAEVTVSSVKEQDDYYEVGLTADGKSEIVHFWKSVSKLNSTLAEYRAEDNDTKYWEVADMSFRLKHVFASTIHKAQGDSLDYVFIDGYDIMSAYQSPPSRYNKPINTDLFNRLMYVAMSRMKKKCIIYTGADDKGRDYKYLEKQAHNIQLQQKWLDEGK